MAPLNNTQEAFHLRFFTLGRSNNLIPPPTRGLGCWLTEPPRMLVALQYFEDSQYEVNIMSCVTAGEPDGEMGI